MRIRRQGWALVDQELEDGLRAIAAPIHDEHGNVIAAANLAVHASRWNNDAIRRHPPPPPPPNHRRHRPRHQRSRTTGRRRTRRRRRGERGLAAAQRRPIGCIVVRWKSTMPAAWSSEPADPPAGLGADEGVAVAAPELAVGRAVDVAVPGVEIGHRLGAVGPVEGDLDVRDVVARRGEGLLEPDGDRRRRSLRRRRSWPPPGRSRPSRRR